LGRVSSWNTMNPKIAIKPGDQIMEINGVRESLTAQLNKALKNKGNLLIKLRRMNFEVGDEVLGLFKGATDFDEASITEDLYKCGDWYKATIKERNRDLTKFTLEWFDGREEERIKSHVDIKRINSTLRSKIDGDYRFSGSHKEHAMYVNNCGAVISFHETWRINFSEASFHSYYEVAGSKHNLTPPTVTWRNPTHAWNSASISHLSGKVCRLCPVPASLKQSLRSPVADDDDDGNTNGM